MRCKSTLAWSSMKEPQLYERLGGQLLALNKATHCFVCIYTHSSAHLGHTHFDNFTRVFKSLTKIFNRLTPYTKYKLFQLMLKRVTFLGLPIIVRIFIIRYKAGRYVDLGRFWIMSYFSAYNDIWVGLICYIGIKERDRQTIDY